MNKAYAAFVARQPMGRVARADEIAGLAAYLASDDSAFVTGAELKIDNGWTLYPRRRIAAIATTPDSKSSAPAGNGTTGALDPVPTALRNCGSDAVTVKVSSAV